MKSESRCRQQASPMRQTSDPQVTIPRRSYSQPHDLCQVRHLFCPRQIYQLRTNKFVKVNKPYLGARQLLIGKGYTFLQYPIMLFINGFVLFSKCNSFLYRL